ncbi:MAG TPA: ATP-binding protein, partial [Nitrococcus sp.]|nr:ATP-binding protein [Nitrococcus sp.]
LAALAQVGRHGLDMDEVNGPPSRLLRSENRATYAMQCADGSRLQSNPPPSSYPSSWPRVMNSAPEFADIRRPDLSLRAVWFRFSAQLAAEPNAAAHTTAMTDTAAQDCRVLLVQPRTELDQILFAMDGILLITPVLALLVVLALSPTLVHHGLKPLTALGESMRSIGPHALGQRLPPAGTRELEPLVARFNEVLTRMDEGLARERQFAGALAHETRTRLAELRTLVEVERRYPSGRSTVALLGEIGGIGGELEKTVAGLLLLTRLDAGIESLERVPIELANSIARQLEHSATTLQRRSLRIDLVPPASSTMLIADQALLDIVIGNLLGNACLYAPAGDSIAVRWNADALIISNHAPDLDEEEVCRFGQRFWSKHHGIDGHAGMGLSLAGAAAAAMGFSLEFKLDAERRLRAILHWKAAATMGQLPA